MYHYLPTNLFKSVILTRFKYRDRFNIVTDILHTVGYDSNGKTKTSIMRNANLNFDQANKYLDLLLIHDYIKAETPPAYNGQEKARYRLTGKGFELLRDLQTLRVALKTLFQKPM